MTLPKWVHDPSMLGNDQPFSKGQKETPGTPYIHGLGFGSFGHSSNTDSLNPK